MAIVWGGFNNHLRVGIEVTNDAYNTYTPSINVYVAVFVQIDSTWNFGDNQRVTLYGSANGVWDFYNNMGKNEVRHIGTVTIGGQGQNYGGGPYYEFGATLSGNYLGSDTGVVPVGYTLPARPPRPPSPPAWPPAARNVTTNYAIIDWGGSYDDGGRGIGYGGLHVALDPGFTQLVYAADGQAFYREIGGLQAATTYYMRAYNANAVGASGWSATSSFSTIGLNIISAPSFGGISSKSVEVRWTYPAAGTPTRYQLQFSSVADFSRGVGVDIVDNWGTSRLVSGLSQRSDYFVRVRAGDNAVWGPWSPVSKVTTTSGVFARQGTQWTAVTPYALVNGVWRPVSAFKQVGGAWVG